MSSEHWSVKGSQNWLSLCFALPNVGFCMQTFFSLAHTLVFMTATLAWKRYIGCVSESCVFTWEFSVASGLILLCPAKTGELRGGMWMRQSWVFRDGYKEAEGGWWRRWAKRQTLPVETLQHTLTNYQLLDTCCSAPHLDWATPGQTTFVITVLTVRCPRWMGWQVWSRLGCSSQTFNWSWNDVQEHVHGPHWLLLSLGNSTIRLLGKGPAVLDCIWHPHVLRFNQVTAEAVKEASSCLTHEVLHMVPCWWTGWAPLMNSKQRNQRWPDTGPGRKELGLHV